MRTAALTAKVNRWLHEHLAIKTPVKLLGGLALGALVLAATALPLGTTYADEPARPLSSGETQCYPEDVVLGWCYGFAATPVPALTADAMVGRYDPISLEILADLARMYAGLDEMVPSDPDLTTDANISGVRFEEWPEAGFDSVTYQRFMSEQGKLEQAKASNRLYSEQRELDFIEDLEIMGIPWRIDDRGRVVVVEEPRKSVAARLPSINGVRCYPEDDC